MRLPKAPLDAAFEDHAPASNAKAAAATDVAIRAEAQHAPATTDAAQVAKPAADSFLGFPAARVDKRAALEGLREAVEKVRELAEQASRHSPLFGEWKPQEGAKEVGEALLNKVVSFARLKGLNKGAEGEFVKLSAAVGGDASAFGALGDEKVAKAAVEAASAIQRVVEKAWAAVRPVVAIASRALANATLAPELVGLADEEFRRAFNVAGDRRPLYFVYSVGDVEYGAVKARCVRAVAFVSGEKMLRIEILAEGVKGLATERVRTWGREWFKLATFHIETESGVVQLTPRVGTSAQLSIEPLLAERLSALVLTDVGAGGVYLGSPDPILHLLYALAVGEAVVKVRGVMFTEAGPTLHLESRAPAERVNHLYRCVARELGKVEVEMGVREFRQWAKSKAVEVIGEYAGEAKRIAKEAKSVEELRDKLVQLFDRVMRKAADEYQLTRSEKALWRVVGAAAAKKFFAENVEDPVWWTLLLLGDGVVRPRDHAIGFAAKPAEAAEAVMHVFARVMGVPLEVQREGKDAVLTRGASRAAVERLFKRLEETKIGNVSALHLLAVVAEWWLGVGTGGSDPPKLLSLFALRELTAGKKGKWLRAWLSYEAAVTTVPEAVEKWLSGAHPTSVKSSRDALTDAVSFDAHFERGGVRFKLHTDLADFYLYCESCRKAAEGVLRAVAEALGVLEPRLEGKDSGKKRLVLPAVVGWATFLKLWHKYDTSLSIEDGDRELLRVEMFDVKLNGEAKFRLWYYKWRETRPDRPYVDIEITYKGKKQGFIGRIYVNVAEGVLKEHLAEIEKLLKRNDMEGVAYYEYEKTTFLLFTGAFRDSVLDRLGIEPELPPGEPAEVKHLGGLRFKIGDKEAEFGKKVIGKTREFYAVLMFPSRVEAERFASSLKAIGVYAEVAGNTVRLYRDSFFGLLAAADATPPGLTLLYRSEEDDFRVYASAEGGQMRFYFAVKHEGVWRVVEGAYSKRIGGVELVHTERDVLEAVRGVVAKALEKLTAEKLGRPAKVGEPKEKRSEEGNVVGYYLRLYGYHLAPFLEQAADGVRAEPADVQLEGRHIVVETGSVKAEAEFKLLKGNEAAFLPVQNVGQTLALYKSLKEVGVRVEITPRGVKVDGETMWALVATAVERGVLSGVPAEVMPGVELLNVHSAGGMKMYIFRVSEEGVHYYFAVRTKEGWSAAGGKYDGVQVRIKGKVAEVVAKAINALYREMGIDREVEVKRGKRRDVPYIQLTNVDLRLLGLSGSENDIEQA